MRVELPSPTPPPDGPRPPDGAKPAAQAASTPGVPPVVTVVGSAPRTLSQRVVLTLTQRAVFLPVCMLCVAVLGWSVVIRLSGNQRLMAVQARALKPIEVVGDAPTAQELDALRHQADAAADALFQDPREITTWVSALEQKARELGWRVETSRRPAVARPGGVPGLAVHPVIVQLDDEPDHAESSYQRLLSWLRTVSSQPQRIEVTGLRLRSAGACLAGAQVQLSAFCKQQHEETPPK